MIKHPAQSSRRDPDRRHIIVNGETRQLADGTSAAQLIEALGLGERRLALELNGEIVPRSQHQ
ncbi:MAG: sulfur carrier protein ThiS, partial [Gammaproteobacteria bacterium]